MVAPPALNVPVKDQSPLPVGSSNPKDIWEALTQLRTDLMALLYQAQAQANQTLHLSGAASVGAPVAGKADCWISSRTAIGSAFANYWTVQITRQGQFEQGNLISSQANGLLSYHEYFMGTFTVSMGDVLGVSLVATGAPPALTIQEITVRCELTPRNNANA